MFMRLQNFARWNRELRLIRGAAGMGTRILSFGDHESDGRASATIRSGNRSRPPDLSGSEFGTVP